MRILLDLQGAQTQSRFRGIGRYSIALAQAIARNAGGHEVWIILNGQLASAVDDIRIAFKDLIPVERLVVFDVPGSVSWETPENGWRRRAAELIRERFIRELRPDIVHVSSLFEGANLCDAVVSVGNTEPHVATAVTLYDLIPLLDPENYLGSGFVRQWYTDKIDNLKRADLLLAISDHSRREAIDVLHMESERIVSILSAHTDVFRPRPKDESIKKELWARYGITLPYLMYNGALESRKNLDGLMRAFSLLPSELRNRHQLVFVGKVSDFDRLRLQQLARRLGIDNQFVLAGHVHDDDLVALFTYCALFIFPSLHEGFGLPALEAMACGAPTIGSNVTSIPEVIGRDDALFDPRDPKDIAAKITDVLTDEAFRESLCEHSLIRAEQFSWDRCAKRAVAAFETLHKKESPKPANWSVIAQEREVGYRRLIDAIAGIPQQPVAASEADLMVAARAIANNRLQADRIVRARELPESIVWRIEGPFDSSYSLALLNRETARALELLGHHVVLHSTEGLGDFPPNPAFLIANPDIASLQARDGAIPEIEADITSRNLYPPRVADMNCRFNFLHHYAWEESGFQQDWVDDFNTHLHGITCLSRHVGKILIDHGVTVPMSVSGCGVDHWERVIAHPSFKVKGKPFRFLHVSSCFPRKGADSLLKAYGQAFSCQDECTLIIKTFPNPHNQIHIWLAEARANQPDFPDVEIIEDDLTDAQLKALFEQCHVLVAPSRAEGFGLPMAEAMLSGIAVITTGWGGQLDFCNEESAWLIDYSFASAVTHFKLFDSVWAEPNIAHLAETMREVFEIPPAARNQRAANGRRFLLEKFRWPQVAARLVDSARTWARMPAPTEPRIGWVSTWNTRCGIASYSSQLIESLPTEVRVFAARAHELTQIDGPEVERCWDCGEDDSLAELSSCIEDQRIDTLVVQFNYSFFNLELFGRFVNQQLDAGRTVLVMMHSTSDPVHVLPHKRLMKVRNALARCQRILVHAPADLNRLKALGLVENVALFPHGIRDFSSPSSADSQDAVASKGDYFTIASYGFFLPHKGLLELIEATALLSQTGTQIRLKMVNAEYPVPDSAVLIQKAKEKIALLGLSDQVQMTTDYLPDDESLSLLADADLIVFPYQNTGESSSAAVRTGLATGRPVAVTPLSIFDDVSPAVHTLPGHSPDQIAIGIQQILNGIANGSGNMREMEAEAVRWRDAHRYTRLGHRLYGMLLALA